MIWNCKDCVKYHTDACDDDIYADVINKDCGHILVDADYAFEQGRAYMLADIVAFSHKKTYSPYVYEFLEEVKNHEKS